MTEKTYALSCLVFLSTTPLTTCWLHYGNPVATSNGGSGSTNDIVVKLSGGGTRIAVGSPAGDGSVSIYEKEDNTSEEGDWNLLGTIQGTEGEGMGDFISFSDDGILVAIRRYYVSPSVVQVYQITSNGPEMIGSNIQVCNQDDNDGQSITLGQASTVRSSSSSSSIRDSAYFVVVSCESYDNHRGKIQVFQLDESTDFSGQQVLDWETYLEPLQGESDGDRFGAATSFVEAPSPLFSSGRVFRVAVSSPNYSDGRGRVQVFTADEDHGWSQFGDDLIGEQPDEMFGAAIAMSTTEDPYLAIGSPHRDFGRGGVQIVHWRSIMFMDPYQWHRVGSRLEGANINQRYLGQAIDISSDGSRVITSSMAVDGGRYYVSIIDRTTFSDISFTTIEPWGGPSVALNNQGSIVAVPSFGCAECQQRASSRDGVQIVLDDSAFCALPVQSTGGSTIPVFETFLDRPICRSGAALLADEAMCMESIAFMDGEFVPCQWVPAMVIDQGGEFPSNAPTSRSGFYQTVTPSENPSVRTPTIESTRPQPSTAPSSPPSTLNGWPSIQYSTPSLSQSSNPVNPGQIQSYPPSNWGGTVSSEMPSHSTSESSPQESTASTSSETKDSTDTPPSNSGHRIRACHCDALGRCISEPLAEGSALSICVDIGSWGILLDVVDCYLHNGEMAIPVIQNRKAVVLDAHFECLDGFCRISTPVESSVFRDSEGFLVVTGSIGISAIRRNLRLSRRHLSAGILNYNTVVLLENAKPDESTVSKGKRVGEGEGGGDSPVAFWLLLAILLLIFITFAYWYLRRRCRRRRIRP